MTVMNTKGYMPIALSEAASLPMPSRFQELVLPCRPVCFGCLVVCLLTSCGCTRSVASSVHAAVEVPQLPPLLVSEVVGGETFTVPFYVHNTGALPLRITPVDKSCTCETVDLPLAPVAPNETRVGRMVIGLKPVCGQKSYHATLKLEQGESVGFVRAIVQFEILANLATEPAQLFHEFLRHQTTAPKLNLVIKQRFRTIEAPPLTEPQFGTLPDGLRLEGIEHLASKRISTTDETAKADSRQSGRESDRELLDLVQTPIWEVQWRATLGIVPRGSLHEGLTGLVTVQDGVRDGLNLSVLVQLRPLDAIQIAPSHVYFGQLKGGDSRKRLVLLRAMDEQEFEVNSVSSDTPAFEAESHTRSLSKLHSIAVTFRGSKDGDHAGTVHVSTTHPKCSELTIAVEGSVQAVADGSVSGQ